MNKYIIRLFGHFSYYGILIFLLFVSFGCVSIKVHVPRTVPEPHMIQEDWWELKSLAITSPYFLTSDIEVEFPGEEPAKFVRFDDVFTSWTGYGIDYSNLYGPVSRLLQKEFRDYPDEYPGKHKVTIRKFRLESLDHCTYNEVIVEFEAEVRSEGNLWEYKFRDGIESRATDCMAFVSTLPLLAGWIIYLPYLGHRGNREDQLNQMGRVALLDFLEAWRKHPVIGTKAKSLKGKKK